jgi:hypothetical protein
LLVMQLVPFWWANKKPSHRVRVFVFFFFLLFWTKGKLAKIYRPTNMKTPIVTLF